MVLKDIVEWGIVVHKNIDGLVAHEILFFPAFLLHLLSTHSHYLGVLLLPRFHLFVEVAAHAHTLQLHVYFPQQVIGCHLLVSVAYHPGLTQKFVCEIFGLVVPTLY